MSFAETQKLLRLIVQTEWGQHCFDLAAGSKIIFGRSPDAQVPIPRASVSQEHLEFAFNGMEVRISDLASSNGTFRMPQDSPFKDAIFPLRHEELLLKLSKSEVTLSWQMIGSSETRMVEKTEIAASAPEVKKTKTLGFGRIVPTRRSHTRGADEPAFPESMREPSELVPAPKTLAQKQVSAPKDLSALIANTSAWLWLSLFCGALFFVSWIGGMAFLHQHFDSSDMQKMVSGGALDIMALWMHSLVRFAPIVGLFYLCLIFALRTIFKRKMASRPRLLLWLRGSAEFGEAQLKRWRAILILVTFLSALLAILWPFLWGWTYGVGPEQWRALVRLNHLDQKVTAQTLSHDELLEHAQQLKALVPTLRGSSLLYVMLMNSERKRILSECGGVGDTPWPQKKNCLQALLENSIDSLMLTQPALLKEMAVRATILLSLDGITRVLPVEGIQSSAIPVFLSALDSAGLQGEHHDIEEVLRRTDSQPQQVLSDLRDLRRSIEIRLEAKQMRMQLPRIIYLQVPGPLESGI